MTRKDRIDDLRHDGVVEADHAGEQRFAALQLADKVLPQFVLDGAGPDTIF